MKKIDSRTSQVDPDRCMAQAGGGRYDLILLAAGHLRELKNKNRDPNQHISAIDALLDLQSGQIDRDKIIAKIK